MGNQGASFLERGIPQTCSEAVADAKPRNPSRSIKRRFPHAAQATRDMVKGRRVAVVRARLNQSGGEGCVLLYRCCRNFCRVTSSSFGCLRAVPRAGGLASAVHSRGEVGGGGEGRDPSSPPVLMLICRRL